MNSNVYQTQHEFDDEALRILGEPRQAIISTINPNEVPHSVPIWYLYRDNTFLISTYSGARRAKNVLKRPNTRVLVVHSGGWISASGSTRLLRDGEVNVEEIRHSILERYLTPQGREHFEKAAGFPDDCIMAVTAEKKMAWKSLNIAMSIQSSGYSLEESLEWFVPLMH